MNTWLQQSKAEIDRRTRCAIRHMDLSLGWGLGIGAGALGVAAFTGGSPVAAVGAATCFAVFFWRGHRIETQDAPEPEGDAPELPKFVTVDLHGHWVVELADGRQYVIYGRSTTDDLVRIGEAANVLAERKRAQK